QILDFNEIDGPFCSCSHRPVKCPNEQWSLTNAISYTFHEKLDVENSDYPECLAITKLSTIISKNWTRQQVYDYRIRKHSIEENGLNSWRSDV
ncbi:unnamed protein product, partial [Rotaria sp. Silwood2]